MHLVPTYMLSKAESWLARCLDLCGAVRLDLCGAGRLDLGRLDLCGAGRLDLCGAGQVPLCNQATSLLQPTCWVQRGDHYGQVPLCYHLSRGWGDHYGQGV